MERGARCLIQIESTDTAERRLYRTSPRICTRAKKVATAKKPIAKKVALKAA
jgi:hypothetical protein